MSKVSILRCNAYNKDEIKSKLLELTSLIGFDWRQIEGKKVLMKPNLLSSAQPEKALSTHPVFVRAAAEIILEARPLSLSIGDSPGIGNCRSIMKENGIEKALEGLPIKVADFTQAVEVTSTLGHHRTFSVATDIEEADIIINLPKVKTHSLMGFTCAVKNMYGTIVGMTKGRYHLEYGRDANRFSKMVTDLCYRRKPDLTLVDGIVAMEGNGPGGGDPYSLGLVLAGIDPTAIDITACRILSLDIDNLPQFKAAKEGGYGDQSPEVVGLSIDEVKVSNFKPAESGKGFSRIPPWILEFFRKLVAMRPIVDRNKCRLCNKCVEICPPTAMKKSDRIEINRDTCINCFCCQEICPFKAIEVKRPLFGRIAAKILK
ncbi:MAG: DUF362 domain-containing protein [Fibrobacteres bacterium]|nr:DUF362 domain-containing protein [Fibrobacterota bacterium]